MTIVFQITKSVFIVSPDISKGERLRNENMSEHLEVKICPEE
jgi:hypothetical protein